MSCACRDNPDAYRNWLRDVARRVGPDVVRSRERDLASLYVAGESAAEAARVVARRGNPAKPVVETYRMVTPSGRPIRQATRVRFPDGRVVAFMDKMPKGEAIKQAEEYLRRGYGTGRRGYATNPWARVFG